MNYQQRPAIDMDVIDNAGHLVGTVEAVEHDHFVVQKGVFFAQSHRIPDSAIDRIANDEVVLRISRDMAQSSSVNHNWADHPDHSEIVPEIGDVERSATRSGVDPRKI